MRGSIASNDEQKDTGYEISKAQTNKRQNDDPIPDQTRPDEIGLTCTLYSSHPQVHSTGNSHSHIYTYKSRDIRQDKPGPSIPTDRKETGNHRATPPRMLQE